MDKPSFQKEVLKKLFYSDSLDDKRSVYLNINILRYLKSILLDNMSEKERGCINLYHLENYLIERALDPATEYIYQDADDFIKNTLDYLKTRPEYWIINSQIYLETISGCGNYYFDDKYENKDLTAIYTYAYCNNFKRQEQVQSDNGNIMAEDIPVNNYINAEDITQLISDPEYLGFVQTVERESFFDIDPTSKTLYDFSIIPQIYKFVRQKYENRLKDFHNFDTIFIKIQNIVLFYSHASYDKVISILWENKQEVSLVGPLINPASKKYRLRVNKVNEEEMERVYIQNQIKLLELEEDLSKHRNLQQIKEFLNFLKLNNVSQAN